MFTALACQPPERTIESTLRYEPPAAHRVSSVSVFDLSIDAVWSRLEAAAAIDPFRVLAAERQAQFLVVEFRTLQTGRPTSDFVDCGAVDREVTNEGRTERFAYSVADPGRDRVIEAMPEHFLIRDLQRTVALQIRTTLSLKSEGDERTRLTLNSRYTVRVESSGQSQSVPRDGGLDPVASEAFGPLRSVASFTSFTEGELSEDIGIRCRPTGEVERLMLALVDRAEVAP